MADAQEQNQTPPPANPQAHWVPLVDEYGDTHLVDPGYAQTAIAKYGFREPTSDEASTFHAKQKFGSGAGNLLGAFAAGAGRAATFGLSDQALTKSGIVAPETLKGLEQAHPAISGAGEMAGIAGSLAAPELAGAAKLLNPVKAVAGLGEAATEAVAPAVAKVAGMLAKPATSPIINKIIAKAGTAGLGSAVEGAFYGAGKDVSENALGDPDLGAQAALANIGYSAAMAGGIGAALGIGSIPAQYVRSKLFPAGTEAQALKDTIAANAERSATMPAESLPAVAGAAPTSLEELQQAVKAAPYQGISAELPAKQSLNDSVSRLPDLQYKPLAPDIESLTDQKAYDIWRGFLDSPTNEQARDVQNYRALMKGEGVQKTMATIKAIQPAEALTSDSMKAGQGLIDAFTNQYQAEKEALSPLFKKFDSAGVKPVEDPQALLGHLQKAIPGAEDALKLSAGGNAVELAPYKASMPFSRNTYGAMQDLVEAVNDKELTLGGLRNVRETMRDRINWLGAPRDAAQISKLRSGLMDYMQDQIQRVEPDLAVRDTFKRYAINEQNREEIERLFGGSISDKATFGKQIKPEEVLDKLFSNTVNVRAAKQLLGPDFDTALGNYLQGKGAQFTDNARLGFSSNKFNSFLRNKDPELAVAFAEKPELLERLKDLTNVMRIIPDSAPINPSGTAKTLDILQAVHKIGSFLNPANIAKTGGELIQKSATAAEQARTKDVINNMLSGKNAEDAERLADDKRLKYTVLGKLEKAILSTKSIVTKGVNKIFAAGEAGVEPFSGYVGSKLTPEEKKISHQKLVSMVQDLSNNPDKFQQTLERSTAGVFQVAPNISTSMHVAAAQATQFLASKAPRSPPPMAFAPKYDPSPTELAKFGRYAETVEKPINVLAHVRDGSVSPEQIETLQAVYPKLLSQMQAEVQSEMSEQIAKKALIPYKTQLGLSYFLGQDLMPSVSQPYIAAAQQAWSTPGAAQARNDLNQRIKTSQKGLSAIHMSAQIQTPMQTAAERGKQG